VVIGLDLFMEGGADAPPEANRLPLAAPASEAA